MKILGNIAILASLAVCACTKPGNGGEVVKPEGDFRVQVTLTDMIGAGSDDSAPVMSWETGDRLSGFTFSARLGDYVQYGSLSADGKTADFLGVAPEAEGKLYFMYPALEEGSGDAVHLDLSVQTGKIDKSKNFMASGPVQYTSGGELDVRLSHIPYLVKAVATFPAGVSGELSDIRFTAGDLYTEADYSIHYGRLSPTVEGEITISDKYEIGADGQITVYLYAFPRTYTFGLTLNAVIGGRQYEGKVFLPDEKVEAGRFYCRNVAMEQPEEPRYQIRDRKFYIDGKEVFLDGVCYNGDNIRANANYDDHLREHGFNAVRSYSISDMAANAGGATAEGISRINSLADKGVYTSFGIDFPKVKETDYSAAMKAECKKQLNGVKANLPVYMKGTENIIIWNLGNETEHQMNTSGHKQRWIDFLKTVNEMSVWIKKNDPYKRPTSITLAGYSPFITNLVLEHAPDLDIICFNSYEGQVETLHSSIMKNANFVNAGKPYMITEYGPLGTWEGGVPRTASGQLIEEVSAQKSDDYKRIYTDHIKAHRNEGCIGSFVFLLGYQTHGDVPTWYAMIDEFEKYMISTIDGLCEAMGTDFTPGPQVLSASALTVNGQAAAPGKDIIVSAGSDITVALAATSPSGNALTYDYYIIEDRYNSGGMVRMLEDSGRSARQNDAGASGTMKAPAVPGKYRLNAYARDDISRKAGFASAPILVK